MIKNYFKIAIRSLSRQKGLASINIFGLSVGIACFTLFLLYAVNEFNFDRFHSNAKNIFRVYRWTEAMNGEEARGDVYMPMPLGPAMKQELPDVENYVRMRDAWGESFIKVYNNVSRLKVSFADPEIFSVFDFTFKYGNPSSLQALNSVVINEDKAKVLFGSENPLGKTIHVKVDGKFQPFTVTGVVNRIPPNSSIQFDALANFHFFETTDEGKRSINKWTRSSFITFIQLRNGSKLPSDNKAIAAFRRKFYPDEEAEYKKEGYVWNSKVPPVRYGLQTLSSMHTNTANIYGGVVENVEPRTIWILLAIAAGVLLIACINFTTLAIGRSAGRSKEVGVRKVIGAGKKQLIFQFLTEAVLLSVFSTILGLLIAKLLLPYFNQLSGRELIFSFVLYPEMIWLLFGLTILVGFLSGAYPALILSGFKPIEVLKSKLKIGGSNIFTRSLVTLQFAVSIGLIISTVIILQQIKFMSHKNPGFNKENVVMVDATETDTKKIYPLFKQALAAQPGIEGIASADMGMGEGQGYSISGFNYKGKQKSVFEYFIDPDYINVMGMQLIAGRNFSPTIAQDTTLSVLINEAMVKDFGWTLNNAVGQQLIGYQETKAPIVIGVVKNFNFRSLSEKIAPQMFHQYADYAPYKFIVRIKPGDPAEALNAMKKAWGTVVADLPFKYDFLDEELNKFYKAEQRWSSIVGWAGGISIFLACLGLFGLAALAAINRTKEIGIRKVLGATVSNIINLLSKDFLKLVAIALVIASPLAWYFMHKWLEDFAYRIHIGWLVFVTTGVAVVLIALVTISLQAIKAAIANPVKSLRTE